MSDDEQDDELATLMMYRTRAREALVWKLEGLSERDVRRPLTPTGTNLLGLVKHLATVEAGYFGDCLGRPWPEPMPWIADDAEDNADMWATAEESREQVLALYHRACDAGDAAIAELGLDATGTVPWWPEERRHPTVRRLVVHMIAETNRHLGHVDIVRELIDGEVGMLAHARNMPPGERDWWTAYVARLQDVADSFA